jgi:hypothetical protein
MDMPGGTALLAVTAPYATRTPAVASLLRLTPDDLPAHLAALVIIDPEHGCWIGTTSRNRDGYCRYKGGSLHRAVWLAIVGPIKPKFVLDHREDLGCASKACCRPGHTLAVTHRENVLRGCSVSAINARKNRCDHGHQFDLWNTYWTPDGRRDCRVCIRDRVRRYRGRLRGADAGLGLAA